MTTENDDVRDVYEAEKRRGRRPVDKAERTARKELTGALTQAIREKDEVAFLNALRRGGVKDGTDEFARALRAFRAMAGQH